jgi:hypothetical protein
MVSCYSPMGDPSKLSAASCAGRTGSSSVGSQH